MSIASEVKTVLPGDESNW